MNLQEQLALGIAIAVKAHKDQFDKGGKPYILHPLHLMNQCLFNTQLATIAVMHDVIEDSIYTMEDLVITGFNERVCNALELLTHKPNQDYLDSYIPSMKSNFDAIRVKLKDLEHNSDITRLKGIKNGDTERMIKYHKAFVMLTKYKQHFNW